MPIEIIGAPPENLPSRNSLIDQQSEGLYFAFPVIDRWSPRHRRHIDTPDKGIIVFH